MDRSIRSRSRTAAPSTRSCTGSAGRPLALGPLHPLPRVVVDLEWLLLRALGLRDVAEVDPDPGPRGAPPAHRVGHHVARLEEPHDGAGALLPALESGQRPGLRGRPRDL